MSSTALAQARRQSKRVLNSSKAVRSYATRFAIARYFAQDQGRGELQSFEACCIPRSARELSASRLASRDRLTSRLAYTQRSGPASGLLKSRTASTQVPSFAPGDGCPLKEFNSAAVNRVQVERQHAEPASAQDLCPSFGIAVRRSLSTTYRADLFARGTLCLGDPQQ